MLLQFEINEREKLKNVLNFFLEDWEDFTDVVKGQGTYHAV